MHSQPWRLSEYLNKRPLCNSLQCFPLAAQWVAAGRRWVYLWLRTPPHAVWWRAHRVQQLVPGVKDLGSITFSGSSGLMQSSCLQRVIRVHPPGGKKEKAVWAEWMMLIQHWATLWKHLFCIRPLCVPAVTERPRSLAEHSDWMLLLMLTTQSSGAQCSTSWIMSSQTGEHLLWVRVVLLFGSTVRWRECLVLGIRAWLVRWFEMNYVCAVKYLFTFPVMLEIFSTQSQCWWSVCILVRAKILSNQDVFSLA